jgi:hypothetical protein
VSAIDNFAALLETTDVMKQVLKTLKEEPARFLRDICRQYEESGRSVPNHRLQSVGYMGEAALKALLSAGLVRQQSGGTVSLYTYEPTEEGLRQYEKLKADAFYRG